MHIAFHGSQRIVQVTEHFIENNDVEPLLGEVVLAVGR